MTSLGLNKSKLSEIIGYSKGQTGWVLEGKAPLTDKFLRIFCSGLNISELWLKTGEGEMRPSQVAGHSDPAVQALVEDELTGTETTLQLTGRELRLIRLFRGATPDRQQRLYDLATEAYLVSKEEEKG